MAAHASADTDGGGSDLQTQLEQKIRRKQLELKEVVDALGEEEV